MTPKNFGLSIYKGLLLMRKEWHIKLVTQIWMEVLLGKVTTEIIYKGMRLDVILQQGRSAGKLLSSRREDRLYESRSR